VTFHRSYLGPRGFPLPTYRTPGAGRVCTGKETRLRRDRRSDAKHRRNVLPGRVTPRTAWEATARRLGKPELRHSCASLAISAGANAKVVQRLLGRKTATMTLDRSGHPFPDDLDAVADRLNGGLRSHCGPSPDSDWSATTINRLHLPF